MPLSFKTSSQIFIVMLAGIFFFSCNEKFTVQPENFSEKIVVESCIFTNTDSVSILLTHSVSAYIKNDSYDSSRLVHNADVKIIAKGNVFSLKEDTCKFYNYWGTPTSRTESNYFIKGLNLSKYNECELEVTKTDQRITAKSIIPSFTKIKEVSGSIYRDESGKSSYYPTSLKLKIYADFPLGIESYYKVTVLTDIYDKEKLYMPSNRATDYLIFRTEIPYKEFSIKIGNINKNFTFKNIRISLDHINKEYYDFLEACRTQRENDDSIFNQDGTEIPSNIQGGFGIFTFIARDTACVTLK